LPVSTKKSQKKRKNGFFDLAFFKRKHELTGAAIMLMAALFMVAIFAYSPQDDSIIENLSVLDFFSDYARLASQRLVNPLGLLGAKLSAFLIKAVLGYPTSIILLIGGFWGWTIFRGGDLQKPTYATIYAVLFSVLIASIFGLTHFEISESMSGGIGRFVATIFTTIIGELGAWSILVLLLLITITLAIDLDLQKTVDRISFLFRDKASEASLKFSQWHHVRKQRREEEHHEEIENFEAEVPKKDPVIDAPFKTSEEEVNDYFEPTSLDEIVPPKQPQPEVKPKDPPFEIKQTAQDFVEEIPQEPHEELTTLEEANVFKNLEAQPRQIDQPEQKLEEEQLPNYVDLPESTRENSTNDKNFIELSDEETIDELISAYTKDVVVEQEQSEPEPNEEPIDLYVEPVAEEKPGQIQPEEESKEPDMELKEAVKEAAANLDDRNLKVQTKEHIAYRFPSVDLLEEPEDEQDLISLEELEENKRKLLDKLKIYKIDVVKIEATVGPRVTLFELELAPDVKVSKIVALEDDLAMALAARGIRIIAPIPGKNAVGVEIPNSKPKIVRIKSVLQSKKFKNSKCTLPIAFGKTISNEIHIDDLAKMPHLLVAGATGSGKSVGINTILASLIYFCSPEKVKFLLIDPKRVELFPYQKLKSHFLVNYKDLEEQIITDTSKAVYALKSVEKEMDNRYERLAKIGVRHVKDYNERYPEEALPYIVVVIDELADMMITAGKEVEEPIVRLAQLARAVGIHLIVATQRPSVDVITGIIKANFPARIAYQVASKVDSRTILDSVGADQLLGNGDMLYQASTQPKPERIQNAFISTEEVERLTDFIYKQKGFKTSYELPAPDMRAKNGKDSSKNSFSGDDVADRDKVFEDAARLVVRHQQGSVSLLQRRLKLGFSRAARVMDQLEQNGIVGPPDGSKAREVLVDNEDSLDLLLNNLD